MFQSNKIEKKSLLYPSKCTNCSFNLFWSLARINVWRVRVSKKLYMSFVICNQLKYYLKTDEFVRNQMKDKHAYWSSNFLSLCSNLSQWSNMSSTINIITSSTANDDYVFLFLLFLLLLVIIANHLCIYVYAYVDKSRTIYRVFIR
mgnify:CR=1 FL=1